MSKDKQLIARLVLVLRNNLTQTVQELNDILKQLGPAGFEPAKVTQEKLPEGIPQIDLAEIEEAIWTSYRTKDRAQPGEASWIKNPEHFTSYDAPAVVLELLAAIKRSDTKRLRLGDMEYFLSGEGKFISRNPAKKEK